MQSMNHHHENRGYTEISTIKEFVGPCHIGDWKTLDSKGRTYLR